MKAFLQSVTERKSKALELRFSQLAGPKAEVETVVHSDSHLKKRFFVFFVVVLCSFGFKVSKKVLI